MCMKEREKKGEWAGGKGSERVRERERGGGWGCGEVEEK